MKHLSNDHKDCPDQHKNSHKLYNGVSDIFNNSAFANRELIVIIKSWSMQHILQTLSLKTKNNLTLYLQ